MLNEDPEAGNRILANTRTVICIRVCRQLHAQMMDYSLIFPSPLTLKTDRHKHACQKPCTFERIEHVNTLVNIISHESWQRYRNCKLNAFCVEDWLELKWASCWNYVFDVFDSEYLLAATLLAICSRDWHFGGRGSGVEGTIILLRPGGVDGPSSCNIFDIFSGSLDYRGTWLVPSSI